MDDAVRREYGRVCSYGGMKGAYTYPSYGALTDLCSVHSVMGIEWCAVFRATRGLSSRPVKDVSSPPNNHDTCYARPAFEIHFLKGARQ